MLLTCSSCNSRYLVNSADLKPNGRTVQCAICGNEWIQKPNLDEEEILKPSISNNVKEKNTGLTQNKPPVTNLPSTYIKEDKPRIINSILVVLLLIIVVISFWFIKNEADGIMALLNFYIQEFYFNLKLIINDLAKLVHQIIN